MHICWNNDKPDLIKSSLTVALCLEKPHVGLYTCTHQESNMVSASQEYALLQPTWLMKRTRKSTNSMYLYMACIMTSVLRIFVSKYSCWWIRSELFETDANITGELDIELNVTWPLNHIRTTGPQQDTSENFKNVSICRARRKSQSKWQKSWPTFFNREIPANSRHQSWSHSVQKTSHW